MPRNNIKKKDLPINNKQNHFLLIQAQKENDQILNDFNSSFDGLKNDDIKKLHDQYGFNNVGKKHKATWYKILLASFFTIFNTILLIIAGINLALIINGNNKQEDWVGFWIIIAMFFIAGTLKFIQDFKSSADAKRFASMIRTTANVKRDSYRSEISINEIVPGDIIYLTAGDMIPADMRLLYAKDLFINQSAITGESEPVEKIAKPVTNDESNMLYCSNICYMGSTVASGSAYGIAIQIGKSTLFGKIANVVSAKKPKTSFNKGISRISMLITATMITMVLIIFILRGCYKTIDNNHPWLLSLTYALSVAIGVVPEMLPMIVTLNLSKESIKLSKQKTIVKNINCIQTFGAMDILCTDKTGTLTEDHIVLQEHLNVNGKEDEQVLFYGCLNSYYQTGLKNLIDKAIINKAIEKPFYANIKNFTKIDEIPFDFERRRMSIILQDNENKDKILITKGASEEILRICNYIKDNNQIIELTDKKLAEIKQNISCLNDNGMRVIAIAINKDDILDDHQFSTADEKNMILVGYIALLDPPKLSAKNAIKDLVKKGINIKILTGDNEKVTKYICKELNLDCKHVLLGEEIDKMSFEEIKKRSIETTIFAKLSPEQKAIIVEALKSNKFVVGFMGDGINDAPAMKSADIAISVDSGVDIAKESSDIILLRKDLSILGNAVIQGRKTFANIMKYIKITLSSNFGNMLSVLIATLWLPFLPMQSIQILFLNLCFDLSQLAIPWDNVDEHFLLTPKNWNAKSTLKFMLWFGPLSSIFDIATFLILYYVLKLNNPPNNPTDIAAFNTCWFIESMFSQAIIVFTLRTKKISFINDKPGNAFIYISIIMLIMCVCIQYIPTLNNALQFTVINNIFYVHLSWIILSYVTLGEISKKCYLKLNNDNLL